MFSQISKRKGAIRSNFKHYRTSSVVCGLFGGLSSVVVVFSVVCRPWSVVRYSLFVKNASRLAICSLEMEASSPAGIAEASAVSIILMSALAIVMR